ncbi:MAG: DinB family protein [Planctomycetes bacterium]|nr:DinB family protein [Planctomycetota bacterium]
MTVSNSIADLLAELVSGPFALQQIYAAVPAEIRGRKPGPGKWSVNEIVLHVADTEIVYSDRVRRALSTERAEVAAFDQDVWASSMAYSALDAELAMDAFAALRRYNYALLKRQPAAAFGRTLIHSENGEMTLRKVVESMARHPKAHVAQIERTLQALRSQRPTRASERWSRDGNLAYSARDLPAEREPNPKW